LVVLSLPLSVGRVAVELVVAVSALPLIQLVVVAVQVVSKAAQPAVWVVSVVWLVVGAEEVVVMEPVVGLEEVLALPVAVVELMTGVVLEQEPLALVEVGEKAVE